MQITMPLPNILIIVTLGLLLIAAMIWEFYHKGE